MVLLFDIPIAIVLNKVFLTIVPSARWYFQQELGERRVGTEKQREKELGELPGPDQAEAPRPC